MQPTLTVGQRVLVNRVVYRTRDPRIGDVVVFHPPAGANGHEECGVDHDINQACPIPTPERSDENFIKRIVAGPGNRLRIEDGVPIVNDRPLDDEFVASCDGQDACDLPQEITVPTDHYFMMGDNRGSSQDSRFWGPVPEDWIIGRAFFTYWPLDRVGLL